MKKLSAVFAICGLFFVGTAVATDITIYHSPSCPHCHHARDFFKTNLIYEYPTLSITEVNVMDESNRQMFFDAIKKCGYESGGVPVIVVGEKCFQGYADFMQKDIRKAVESDMSDADKATAAANRKSMESDADAFRSANAARLDAISEYNSEQKKTGNNSVSNSGNYWYILLIVAAIILGLVVIKRRK